MVWIRDEIVYPWLGPERGRKMLGFFWTLFFFILFCNLLGFIPFGEIFGLLSGGKLSHLGGTATGTMSTTVALAVITFFCIHNYVKVFITPVFFTEQGLENVFYHFHHGGTVNIFGILKFLECLDQIYTCHVRIPFLVSCQWSVVSNGFNITHFHSSAKVK